MKRKNLFTAVLLLLLLAVMLPLCAEETPFLEGLPDYTIGPDQVHDGQYTTSVRRYRSDRNSRTEGNTIIPWFSSIGFTLDTTPKEAVAMLSRTGILYVTSAYYAGDVYIWGFWKENPRYFVTAIFDKDEGFLTGTEVEYHEDMFRWKYIQNAGRITMQKFYEEQFDRLSELEKYACAFSSNLVSGNNHSVYTFKVFDERTSNCASMLSDGWDIYNKEDLYAQAETLLNKGHHGSYNRLKKLLNDNAPLSVREIGAKYMLGDNDIARLYFIEAMQDTLGEHGIEAWDYGRAINLFRWSYEAGYVTYEEALAGCEPFVERCRASYVDWKDFMAHYIAGRAFWALYDMNAVGQQLGAIGYCERLFNEDLFTRLPMDGVATSETPAMTLKLRKTVFTPDREFTDWNNMRQFFEETDPSEEMLWESYGYVNQYPDMPIVRMLQLTAFFDMGMYSQTLPLFRQAAPLFQPDEDGNVPEEARDLYCEFWADYAVVANNSFRSDEALAACEMIDKYYNQGFLDYERSLAFVYRVGTSPLQAENEAFRAKAAEYAASAVKNGYDVPQNLLTYLGVEL